MEGNVICKRDLTLRDMKAADSHSLEFEINTPSVLQFRVFSHGIANFKTDPSPSIIGLQAKLSQC